MLRFVNLAEFQDMLLKVSELIDLQDLRDLNYVTRTKRWLADLERILESNRMIEAGQIAALRGTIVSAEDGMFHNGVEFLAKPTKRKMVEAATSAAIRHASSLVSQVIQGDIARIAEAERTVRQLVAIAKAKGLLQGIPPTANPSEALMSTWRTLAQDPDIAPGTVNVEGLVGPHDALILLDRVLVADAEPGR